MSCRVLPHDMDVMLTRAHTTWVSCRVFLHDMRVMLSSPTLLARTGSSGRTIRPIGRAQEHRPIGSMVGPSDQCGQTKPASMAGGLRCGTGAGDRSNSRTAVIRGARINYSALELIIRRLDRIFRRRIIESGRSN